MNRLEAICYTFGYTLAGLSILSAIPLSVIFWVVVGLCLWYARSEFKRERELLKTQNENNLRMETL
jgi:hypothetical protein